MSTDQHSGCGGGIDSPEAFYREVARDVAAVHDAYSEIGARFADEDTGEEPRRKTLTYVAKYLQDDDIDLEDDWNRIEESYFDTHSTTRQHIFAESKNDLAEVAAGGVLLGAAGYGVLTGHPKPFIGALGLFEAGHGLYKLHAEHGPRDVIEGLKYIYRNRSLPPSEEDVERWAGLSDNLYVTPTDKVGRDVSDLRDLEGDDTEDIDIEELGTLSRDELDDDTDMRMVVYRGTLPNDNVTATIDAVAGDVSLDGVDDILDG